MNKFLIASLVLAPLLTFQGCGGGGSGTASPAPVTQPVTPAGSSNTASTPPGGSTTTPSNNANTDPVTNPPVTPPATAVLGMPSTFSARSLDLLSGGLVAVSTSGFKATSTNGKEWTVSATQSGITAESINRAALLNGNYYAATNTNGILKSSDAITWNAATGGPAIPKAFASSASVLVAVGFPNAQSTRTIATSTAGTTWTAANGAAATTETWNGVTYGNNTFVAVGDNGRVATSANGIDWSVVTVVPRSTGLSFDINLQAVAWASFANKFLAVGNFSRLYTSPNGTTWTEIPTTTVNGPVSNSLTITCFETLCIGSNSYVTSGPTSMFSTTNATLSGFSWSTYGQSENQRINFSVAKLGSTYVASGQAGSILTSDNAINWTEQSTR
jgi:hypothetical protein